MQTQNLFPVAFLDAPQILNTSVTPIPGSGSLPLQVIANSGTKAVHAIDFQDTTGDYIGVYTGASGQEVLRAIIGGGVNHRAWVVIPTHSRVSLRSMTATAISNGDLSMTLMGFGYN